MLTEEAKGRLMTRELVEVEMLKIVPAVPVETLAITLLLRVKEVEVPINTFCPPLTVSKALPEVKSPKVVVPMPPLDTANNPVTSEEPRLMAPLNNWPPEVERTGRANDKELIVVEPLAATWNSVVPDEEATVNSGTVPGWPCRVTVEEVEVVPMAKRCKLTS